MMREVAAGSAVSESERLGETRLDTIQTTAADVRKVPIQELVKDLQKLGERDFLAVQTPLEVLRANPVDAESLQPYLVWNAQHYTRNLIDKTDLYELLAICWEVGMSSSIHNHKGQNCWMAAAMGRLAVHNYRVLEEDLASQHCDIVPTDVVEITAANPVAVDPLNPVHDVRNPREFGQRAVSLHLYSRPFDSCIVYSVEQHSCGEIGLQYTSMYGKPV
jgi:cysteine dioxygenase